MTNITGKNILLTGASRGLGVHIAHQLARQGANLALVARDASALQKVADSLRATGAKVVALPFDLLDTPNLQELVSQAESALGAIDILVNNAAWEAEGAFVELSSTTIHNTIKLNLEIPLQLAHLLLPGMLARKSGHIVNMSSLGGKKGAPYDALYCGTKAALVEWGCAMALELVDSGVNISTICPGYVTGEGMFAKFGISAPAFLGSTTPEKVAQAVANAIRSNHLEVIVNSMPVRPLLALNALSPAFGNWVLNLAGVTRLQLKKIGKAG